MLGKFLEIVRPNYQVRSAHHRNSPCRHRTNGTSWEGESSKRSRKTPSAVGIPPPTRRRLICPRCTGHGGPLVLRTGGRRYFYRWSRARPDHHETRVAGPVEPTTTGWSSPVETTSYVGDLDKLDHPGWAVVGPVLAPTQGPLERAASPILAPVRPLRARAARSNGPRRTSRVVEPRRDHGVRQ